MLEATGYLADGAPAHGVRLGDDARSACRSRDFAPDALWRSESGLSAYFKLDAFAGRLARETGRFWQQASTVNRRTSVDRQLLRQLSALERSFVAAGLDAAQPRA